jgi:hypothetical protein
MGHNLQVVVKLNRSASGSWYTTEAWCQKCDRRTRRSLLRGTKRLNPDNGPCAG